MSVRFLNQSFFRPEAREVEKMGGLRAAISADISGKYGDFGDLLSIYTGHRGEGVHKWHHYLPLYDRYFSRWRNRPLRFLEIGVSRGGSLEMWRRYFGAEAVIFGIDINPDCARFDGRDGQVRIGSQDDAAFLDRVVDEMGGVDVVLDDGSHMMAHIGASLTTLFPRLSAGGTYMIEDLHTAYWEQYGGGADRPENFYATLRSIIDDMHRWYHDAGIAHPATAGQVTGIHVHDSMVVLDKGTAHSPVHSMVGAATDAGVTAHTPQAESKAG